jgi:hypothetical protein
MSDAAVHEVRAQTAERALPFGRNRTSVVVFAVLFLALWVTAGAISRSYLIGRLTDPITHNDVNYIIDGIRRLLYIEINGFWAELKHLYWEPMHAPLSGYQAALAFFLFGFHDWAPYASDIIYVLVFLGACALLMRDAPPLVAVAGLLSIAGMPLAYSTVSEFAPEIPLSLFTALGVLLTVRIPILQPALRARAIAGLCFGVALLGKPSSFVFVPLVVCATLGVRFLRDVLFMRDVALGRRLRLTGTAILHGVAQLLLALWLPALYLIPNYEYYADYFYLAMFDTFNVKAFGGVALSWDNWKAKILYYLTGGPPAEYLFGNLLWAYIGTVAIGLAGASWRGDRPFVARQIELLALMVIMWLMPTLSAATNMLFAAPAGYLLAFMVVTSIVSVYRTVTGAAGVTVAGLLGVSLLIFGTSRPPIPNTPSPYWARPATLIGSAETPAPDVIREQLPLALDRLRDVMLGNAPNYHHATVYLTNVGYYHTPVLWYWFLKKDPMLDWSFPNAWRDSDIEHHFADIRDLKDGDFVVAGESGNGLTFAPRIIPGAAAVEGALFEAMLKNPNFMLVDRFYGPTGRAIAVFQKRTAFAGWRPLTGLTERGVVEQSWVNSGEITHLQAYAAAATPAYLAIEVRGPPRRKIAITVNWTHVTDLTLDDSGNASIAQPIDLLAGQNDIVMRYDSGDVFKFKRLTLIRKIAG